MNTKTKKLDALQNGAQDMQQDRKEKARRTRKAQKMRLKLRLPTRR